jgi:hypothetical protein
VKRERERHRFISKEVSWSCMDVGLPEKCLNQIRLAAMTSYIRLLLVPVDDHRYVLLLEYRYLVPQQDATSTGLLDTRHSPEIFSPVGNSCILAITRILDTAFICSMSAIETFMCTVYRSTFTVLRVCSTSTFHESTGVVVYRTSITHHSFRPHKQTDTKGLLLRYKYK